MVSLKTDLGPPNKKQRSIHQLVCLTFVGEKPCESYTVDHIDQNKVNNYYKNLRWASRTEQNMNKTNTPKAPRKVRLTQDDQIIKIFQSIDEAMIHFRYVRDTIRRACKYGHPIIPGQYLSYDDQASIEGEEWREADAVIGKCVVSSVGRVKYTTGKITYGTFDVHGYRIACPFGKGKKRFQVHILVALAFIGGIPKGKIVNHKDGIKDNNKVENLEIITVSENSRHAVQKGLIKTKPVAQLCPKTNRVISVYKSRRIAAEQTGIKYRTVYDVSIIPHRKSRTFGWKLITNDEYLQLLNILKDSLLEAYISDEGELTISENATPLTLANTIAT